MPTLKVDRFHGIFPRLDRRNIPAGAAQEAVNVRFDSGDLRPLRKPLNEETLTAGDIGHLFWYRYEDEGGKFISFGRNKLVQAIRSTVANDAFRRWYWNIAGEGMRYISDPLNPNPAGAAAPVGSGASYRAFKGVPLGIPAPEAGAKVADVTPDAAIGFGTDVGVASIARTNPMTVNTGQAHGFESGWTVQIDIDESLAKPQDVTEPDGGLPDGEPESGGVGQIWALDGASGIVTAVSDNQFSISGISATSFQEFEAADLAALTIKRTFRDSELESRAYVWTYVSQYGEEGPPSPASNIIDVQKEGAVVALDIGDVRHQPSVTGGSREYINRIRVYRSAAGDTGVVWLFVGELQYSGAAIPDDSLVVSGLASEPVTAEAVWIFLDVPAPDDYAVGDEIDIFSPSDSGYRYSGVIKGFANGGPGPRSIIKTNLATADVDLLGQPNDLLVTKGLGVIVDTDSLDWTDPPNSASPADPWTATLTESVDPIALGERLQSEGWYPPPLRAGGMAELANGVIAVWRGNTVWFSDRYLPHAYDPDNRVTLADEVVGGASYGNTLVLGTRGRPYIVTGIDPSAMVARKLELHAPLVADTAIIDAGFGVLYISRDGLVLVDPNGARYMTKGHYTEQEWLTAIAGRERLAFYDGLGFVFGPNKNPIVFDVNSDSLEVSTVELNIAGATQKDGELAVIAYGPASEYRQVQLFKNSDQAMTAKFTSGLVAFRRPVNPSVAQVYADNYPLTMTLRHIRPGSYPEPVAGQPNLETLAEHTYTVKGPEPFRLHAGFVTREFEMTLETEHRVQQVVISTSMDELRAT